MSAATEEALREAIIAHTRDINGDDGDLLTDWVVCACWEMADDAHANAYSRCVPSGQPYHRSIGLMQQSIDDYHYVNLRMRDVDEDDD